MVVSKIHPPFGVQESSETMRYAATRRKECRPRKQVSWKSTKVTSVLTKNINLNLQGLPAWYVFLDFWKFVLFSGIETSSYVIESSQGFWTSCLLNSHHCTSMDIWKFLLVKTLQVGDSQYLKILHNPYIQQSRSPWIESWWGKTEGGECNFAISTLC